MVDFLLLSALNNKIFVAESHVLDELWELDPGLSFTFSFVFFTQTGISHVHFGVENQFPIFQSVFILPNLMIEIC